MGRRPSSAPFLFEDMRLPDLWRLLAAEREDKSDLGAAVVMLDSRTASERRPEIDDLRQSLDNIEVKELPDGCLPRLAASLLSRPGTNLLQGQYAARSNLHALAEPWRVAAAFLIGFVAFSVVAQGAAYFKLLSDDRALDRQVTEICTREFRIEQLSGCRVEMQRRLNEAGQTASGAGGGWLASLAAVAEFADDGLAIERIDYRNRVMALEVVATSVPHLDAFDRRLTETGRFAVEIQSTRDEDGGGYRSRLQVMAAEP
jgi:type II secretory pathway component PulL